MGLIIYNLKMQLAILNENKPNLRPCGQASQASQGLRTIWKLFSQYKYRGMKAHDPESNSSSNDNFNFEIFLTVNIILTNLQEDSELFFTIVRITKEGR